jgi:hypothetical protein
MAPAAETAARKKGEGSGKVKSFVEGACDKTGPRSTYAADRAVANVRCGTPVGPPSKRREILRVFRFACIARAFRGAVSR